MKVLIKLNVYIVHIINIQYKHPANLSCSAHILCYPSRYITYIRITYSESLRNSLPITTSQIMEANTVTITWVTHIPTLPWSADLLISQ